MLHFGLALCIFWNEHVAFSSSITYHTFRYQKYVPKLHAYVHISFAVLHANLVKNLIELRPISLHADACTFHVCALGQLCMEYFLL
uniref:Putative secreted protein n=1 Tax=Ixodes ricinus TaxID=34613 RepID=A0A147BQF8_IXORI